MLRAKRPVMASILASTLILTGTAPSLGLAQFENSIEDRPGEIAMIGDAAIARPVLLASTLIGTGLFIVTLPFSALGGNIPEAGEYLVAAPARSTFLRCLGCTRMQHESLQAKRKTEAALRKQNDK